jgi:hypothetical protein
MLGLEVVPAFGRDLVGSSDMVNSSYSSKSSIFGTQPGDNSGAIRGVAKRVASEGLPQSVFPPGGAVGLALTPTLVLKVQRALS